MIHLKAFLAETVWWWLWWWEDSFWKGPKIRQASLPTSQLHLSAEYLMPRPCELWMMLVENNTVLNNSTGAAKTESSAAAALWQQQQIGSCDRGAKRPCERPGQISWVRTWSSAPQGMLQDQPDLLKVDVREALFKILFSYHWCHIINKRGRNEPGKGLKPEGVMKPGTEIGKWNAARESSE